MNMEAKLWFMVLCGLAVLLSYLAGFWRRKTAAAAFAAARAAATAKERDRYCRLAVLAGHREACLMFCFARSDFFEDHQPLKPFKSHGIKVAFYGYYYPSRYADLIDDEQRAFCCSLYQFKEGENHGIEFFKACMSVLNLADAPYHILFMPCSDEFKYARRFKRLDWYITTQVRAYMMSMCSSHATACTRRKAAKTVSSKGTTVSRGISKGNRLSSWTTC